MPKSRGVTQTTRESTQEDGITRRSRISPGTTPWG